MIPLDVPWLSGDHLTTERHRRDRNNGRGNPTGGESRGGRRTGGQGVPPVATAPRRVRATVAATARARNREKERMAGALSSQTTADPAEADEPGEPGEPVTGPSRRLLRITFLGALVAFFLMSAGWAIGLPVNGTYDENQHVLRAYAAGSGQLYSKPGLTNGY